MKRYIVTAEFADRDNISKHYKPGDELPGTFGKERLANIVSRGLARAEEIPAGKGNNIVNTSVTDIDLTGRAVDIAAAVKVFEDAEKLAQYLAVEQSAAEPRKMVVKALEDRIAALVKKESHDV